MFNCFDKPKYQIFHDSYKPFSINYLFFFKGLEKMDFNVFDVCLTCDFKRYGNN